ncbi:hypothetical protein FPSE_00306 [Fusarium pseudograminearum CS3096]|uniref:Kinesin motor domain-containing protein n=1 Tax=Fusarium pseudograminearum (strain CS3096) TaxID=1028729 RepID=K3VUD9_FUSPC|nr:hypothetical protein FPSE_00306 [Fusarium pseudograminearum CS3096]EKJ79487.1 hypothetical protein FPSE_00306 [Fusarium pseudograminearum CS3096]
MEVDSDNGPLSQFAAGAAVEKDVWSAVRSYMITRLDKIAHNDFPIPNLPPPPPAHHPVLESHKSPPPPSPPRAESSQETNNDASTTESLPATQPIEGALPKQLADMLIHITKHLETFEANPPHTIQRLAELILRPKAHYRALAPYLHAVDRVVQVTSSTITYPLPPPIPDMSSMHLNGEDPQDPAVSVAWSNPTTAALGTDEALGGALLTPIPWLTRRSPESSQDTPGAQIHSEGTETIEGPNGVGSIETVSVSVNGIHSTGHARGVTQGELLRQEQRAGVVPVSQLSRAQEAAHEGERMTMDEEEDEEPPEEEEEVPHARGPEEIGMSDTGPQSTTTSFMSEGGMGMQGIDVEAAVGRKHDDDEEAKDDVDADGEAAGESDAKSPGAESVGTKREAEQDLEADANKKLKEEDDQGGEKTNGDAADVTTGAKSDDNIEGTAKDTKAEDDPDKMDTEYRIGVATGTRAPNTRPGVRAGSRAPPTRYGSSAATRNGAASPTPSVASVATVNTIGTKRKERDFEAEASTEETNIQVVVRCRGRNEREVKENSNVVVTADSVRGKVVELSMGSNALSNRSYNFDRVFSPAADQYMVFDDTVKPILDEMLSGYNCTIFAYGQTGTGKTYTMSGDMTETMGMLSDDAGIIPRVLQTLFTKLELDNAESTIKCSFIELYNEELRDLLASDEGTKLKIYDDTSRRGHASTIVQGMEEKHIKDAAEGVKVLQEGSLKRQVAATKCNDLSSRSHTVFTITTYVRKPNEHGVEALVSAGKLNLVDLAGSENIQRSGAENKRATEAGLINKSLLTLGRVINALVDKGSHIPYRESKLTRLLQDSLGGRTKTCIIATISPAKINLEETISTLEYAFRAKNIKNKPQMNPMIEKKTLLKDFTMEIERLKSELIATRQRNGVYLSNESYEEMTAQSESRRIVNEEQSAKLDTLEKNLRNKVQELFSLQSTFLGLKKDHEGTRAQLDDTKEVLDQTEIVLSATRQSLSEETKIRKAHQKTEQKLTEVGGELIDKLHKTVSDVGGLHAKNRRKSDLQSINRNTWTTSQNQVADVTSMVERRIGEFQEEQQEHIASVGHRMGSFVDEELRKLSSTQAFLDEHLSTFADSKKELLESKQKSKDDMDGVLEEIKVVRDTVKERMGESLQSISHSAERIAADMMNEMTAFHGQLHNSYSALGKDFKSVFEELVKHITAQRAECDNLKRQLQSATNTIVLQNATISSRIQDALAEERRLAVDDRQKLMAQISTLINTQAETQESRMQATASEIQKTITSTSTNLEQAVDTYGEGMSSWDLKEGEMLEEVKKSRDQLKTKLKDDWTAADGHSSSIQATAKSVHAETVRAVDEQIKDLDVQMEALDDFVTRARTENGHHHETHSQSVDALSNTVEESFGNISAHFKSTFDRVKNLGEEMEVDLGDLQDCLEPLKDQLCQPLANLREDVAGAALQEYQPTGETPAKVQYHYPTDLPRTEDHDLIISSIDEVITPTKHGESADKDATIVFADLDSSPHKMMTSPVRPATRMSMVSASEHMGMPSSLREVNPNVPGSLTTGTANYNPRSSIISMPPERTMPLFKRPTRVTRSTKKVGSRDPIISEGGENVLPTALEESLSRRKSPRIN